MENIFGELESLTRAKLLIGYADFAIGAVGVWFESRAGQIRHIVVTAAALLRSCVAQAPSCEDWANHSFTLPRNSASTIKISFIFLFVFSLIRESNRGVSVMQSGLYKKLPSSSGTSIDIFLLVFNN